MNYSRNHSDDARSAFCSPFPLGKGVRGIGRREDFFRFPPSPWGKGTKGLGCVLHFAQIRRQKATGCVAFAVPGWSTPELIRRVVIQVHQNLSLVLSAIVLSPKDP